MKTKKCKICKKEMLLCGFGRPNSMYGNARWECRNKDCKSMQERNKMRGETK